ncbi:MAG TPA: DUF1697 domain-containing protein [Acidimicrobiia bacterium]|nr:DUF1697 domain-containing protein [Acidimicrobiia bacterium]
MTMVDGPPGSMRHVAFLRAINTGNRRLKMADLRRAFDDAGFGPVATHLATGNVIFPPGPGPNRGELEGVIRDSFGFMAEVFLRDEDHVRTIVDRSPWPPWFLVEVSFLEREPDRATARELEATIRKPEALIVDRTEVFFRREGKGIETVHKEATTERILGMRTTRRGLSTITGIVERYLET